MPQPRPTTDPATVLRKASFFEELSETELTSLVRRTVWRQMDAGELIFSEGDPCPGMWVVATGRVKIFKSSPSGREQVLALDGPGHTIAELPVFDGGNYPASAQAVEASTLLFISKQDFHAACMQYPEISLKVLRVIGGRLRGLVSIIEELSFTTVRSRMASLLLRLAQNGRKITGGLEITLPASNQEIAAQVGTVRELVSRNLSRLQASGAIQLKGRTVLILNLRMLQEEVENTD